MLPSIVQVARIGAHTEPNTGPHRRQNDVSALLVIHAHARNKVEAAADARIALLDIIRILDTVDERHRLRRIPTEIDTD